MSNAGLTEMAGDISLVPRHSASILRDRTKSALSQTNTR